MQVILKQDIKTLGKKDTVVNVSDGYANNYLIPRGLAVSATNANISEMKSKQAAIENKAAKELKAAKGTAALLQGKTFVLKAKSGENGKLFGAISSKDIADNIKNSIKMDVDKKKIVLSEPIKALGTFEVEIKIYPGVSAKFNVEVKEM